MKYILELILTTVIIFFVWNFLKRIFFTSLFKFPKPRNNETVNQQQTNKKNLNSNIKWDAETVDYEEVEETKNK
ncbi:hypothetical protein FNJ88_01985 [Chryseobacterium sp. SNU WT5]|uniref:hypothetical protein n=1 Tax=Chryseobacterium sp. SNU WT5 TaxID=2594269 RepID=UPI00117C1B39|nr:hypothetical protein [Chryseobacterium sp. SNU WT5]QDP84383.1 hypothetical protein FNJ88_01985 [Chryseobacterium sp. SNU WT5]